MVTRVGSNTAPLSTAMSSTQPLLKQKDKKNLVNDVFKINNKRLPKVGQDHGACFAVSIYFGHPRTDHVVPFIRRSVDYGRLLFRHLRTEFASFWVKDSLLDASKL